VVSDPEERASHLALGAEGPSEIVAATLDEASKHAAGRGAPDAAAAFSEQALRLTPRPDDQSFRRLIQAMDHHFMVGDMSRSAELAEEFLTTMPAGPRRAALLFRLGVIHGRTGGYSGAEELLSSALAEVGDDAGLRIDVEQELAFTLSASGDMGSALEHARAGLAEAEVSGDARQLATALTSVAGYEFLTGLGVRDDLFHRAEQLDAVAAPGGAGQLLSLAPDVAWGCVLKWADFFERGRRKLEEGYRTFVEQGDESALPFILYQLSELECWAGRWVLAERYAADAVRLAGQSEQEGMLTAALYARGLIDAHRGRVGEARTTLDDTLRLCDRTNNLAVAVQTRSVLGFLALSLEDHGRAVEHLGDLADGVAAMGAHEPGTPRFLADAIEASIGIGNLVRADTLVEHLEERGRTLGRPWALATGARCRGLLRAAKGDLEAAVDSFDRAFIEHERLAMPFELGRTHLVAGTVHRRAKRKKVAKQHLTEALAIFERLGAPLWSVKARTEIDRLGLRRTAPLDLTPTERRVAELVADGRTNREVADALFMSVKTVDSNLSRIYRKLGVRSRTELAHGWPASDHAPPAESRDQSEAFS
jgi:DNA-binding CsgD family transcriptional regulator